MGWSTKKQTQDTTTHQVETPNVPQWGVDSLQNLNSMTNAIAGTDPTKFVAGPSQLQTQAFNGASQLGGWQGNSDAAAKLASTVGAAGANTAAPATQAQSAGVFDGGISKYLNPETDNLVNTTLADFDQNAGETRARQAAQGALSNAFGGSRWGLQEGETEGQLSRARATTDANLRSTAFDRATALADSDASRRQATNLTNAAATNQNAEFNASQQDNSLNRQQSVAALLSSIANSSAANSINDVTTQGQAGDDQRTIEQAQATAPISLAQTVSQLLAGGQLPLLTGSTTDGTGSKTTKDTPSTFSQIGQGLQMAQNLAALFA